MEDESDDDLWDPAGRANSEPDASVTPDLFKAWRSPRFGQSNPECMNNPVWEWLVRTRLSAYWANEKFSPSAYGTGPCWCFRRFGQSKTKLPDGRLVLIGGEHEDFYDPDFYIYNDVVVRRPDEGIEIFGYPKEIFAPTDSHSATLIDNRIVLVGGLGYPEQRKPGTTPVYSLDLQSFSISAINCTGEAPGWLHKHAAAYAPEENAILITGGLLVRDDDRPSFVENIDDWKLHLADRRWERMTRRRWKRWDIRRSDDDFNQLFSICSAWKLKDIGGPQIKEMFEQGMQQVEDDLGFRPDLDLYGKLYAPPVPHEKIPEREGEFHVHRIQVNGVTVRYNEQSSSILITIEGDLPASIADLIVSDLVDKVSALERTRYDVFRL
jgi:hypothetical protein